MSFRSVYMALTLTTVTSVTMGEIIDYSGDPSGFQLAINNPSLESHLVNFDDLTIGEIVHAQYQDSHGMTFEGLGGLSLIADEMATGSIPTSPPLLTRVENVEGILSAFEIHFSPPVTAVSFSLIDQDHDSSMTVISSLDGSETTFELPTVHGTHFVAAYSAHSEISILRITGTFAPASMVPDGLGFDDVLLTVEGEIAESEMVLVPAGSFPYQDTSDPEAWVYVDTFMIDKYEVTNQLYAQFLNAADPNSLYWTSEMEILRFGSPSSFSYAVHAGSENYPVRFTNFFDAEAYAAWRSSVDGVSYRLPTGPEREKAAAWDPVGQHYYTYGFQQDVISCDWCNYDGEGPTEVDQPPYCNTGPLPVGSYDGTGSYEDARSYYGCYDMSGNVWEWTSEASGEDRIVRGGAWGNHHNWCKCTATIANPPTYRHNSIGFRLVREFDGNVLIVDTAGYVLWGNIDEYDLIHVIDGGSIVVPEADWDGETWIGGYLILDANTIYVDATSSIRADGVGFHPDDGYSDGGPGQGAIGGDVTCTISGGGGAFGAMGGSCWTTAQPGTPYGSAIMDDTFVGTLFGSAGGDYGCTSVVPPFETHSADGGRGGGYIKLLGRSINIEGTVTADGASGEVAHPLWPSSLAGVGSGGGSGGQIVINGDFVTVMGEVRARGGDGSDPSYWASGGGGSGGRIKVSATIDFDCGGMIHAPGGIGACGGLAAGLPVPVQLPGVQSAPPTDLDLLPEDDIGFSATDFLTSIANPRITGLASPNAVVQLFEGTTSLGTGVSDSSGAFVVGVATTLADGVHTITATVQEECHSESVQSGELVVLTIDTQPPAMTGPFLFESPGSGGALTDDGIVSSATPTFVGTGESGTMVRLFENDIMLGSTLLDSDAWQIESSVLGEGTHQLSAQAMDAAGNLSPMMTGDLVLIDLTPPVVSSVSVFPTECRAIGSEFVISVEVSDALSGTTPDAPMEATIHMIGASDTIELPQVGEGLFAGTWASTGLPFGVYSVDIQAFDLAGNSTEATDQSGICMFNPSSGDCDADGDVDLVDFAKFQLCFTGVSSQPVTPSCECVDFDFDSDVDLVDFGQFQLAYSQ
jgi:formylglycine-generating enzyme required for sulfatase activity